MFKDISKLTKDISFCIFESASFTRIPMFSSSGVVFFFYLLPKSVSAQGCFQSLDMTTHSTPRNY